MCNCRNSNPLPKAYVSTPSPRVDVNCEKTINDIQNLYNRLLCTKNSYFSKTENIYLGKLLTMINLKEYCKYDVTEIEEFVTSKNC